MESTLLSSLPCSLEASWCSKLQCADLMSWDPASPQDRLLMFVSAETSCRMWGLVSLFISWGNRHFNELLIVLPSKWQRKAWHSTPIIIHAYFCWCHCLGPSLHPPVSLNRCTVISWVDRMHPRKAMCNMCVMWHFMVSRWMEAPLSRGLLGTGIPTTQVSGFLKKTLNT